MKFLKYLQENWLFNVERNKKIIDVFVDPTSKEFYEAGKNPFNAFKFIIEIRDNKVKHLYIFKPYILHDGIINELIKQGVVTTEEKKNVIFKGEGSFDKKTRKPIIEILFAKKQFIKQHQNELMYYFPVIDLDTIDYVGTR